MPLGNFPEGLFKVGAKRGVRLVAHLDDKNWFSAPDDVVRVFVPDLHLLPKRARFEDSGKDRWKFSFHRDRERDLAARVELLEETIALLRGSFGTAVEVFQLGDFVDFWRAAPLNAPTPDSDRDAQALSELLGEIPSLRDFARSALFVSGNHDATLPGFARRFGMDVVRSRLLRCEPDGPVKILVTHGDAFDGTEVWLPDTLQAYLVGRFGTGSPGSAYDLRSVFPGSRPAYRMTDAFVGEKEVVGVRDVRWTSPGRRRRADASGGDWADADRATHSVTDPRFLTVDVPARLEAELTAVHELLPRAIDAFRTIDEARLCGRVESSYGKERLGLLGLDGLNREALAGAGSPASGIELMVVGHSHHPRIVRCEEVADPYGGGLPVPTGRRFVLMDCGAWVERAVYRGDGEVASCHLGVQCGSDLRIYQFDPIS